MHLITLCRLFCVSLLLFPGCSEARAQAYSNQSGHYEINFPCIPQFSVDTIATEAGSLAFHSAVASGNPDEAFLVVYCDYPHEQVAVGKPYAIIDAAKKGALSNFSTKAARENKITQGINPGLEFEAESVNYVISYRIFLAGDRLFQVGYVRKKSAKHPVDFKKYLDTFKIL